MCCSGKNEMEKRELAEYFVSHVFFYVHLPVLIEEVISLNSLLTAVIYRNS